MADTPETERESNASAEPRGALIAWAFYDWANSAFAALITTFILAAYFTRQVASDPTLGTTLWGNAIAAAGLLVALLGPILGAMADQGGPRRGFLAGFTLIAVAATALLWFVRLDTAYVPLALVLVALGTLAAELAGVLYNALLPALAPPSRTGRWSGWGWVAGLRWRTRLSRARAIRPAADADGAGAREGAA